MNKGVVTSVVLKQDTINGKVLMIDGDKVELENYGVLYLDDNSMCTQHTASSRKQT